MNVLLYIYPAVINGTSRFHNFPDILALAWYTLHQHLVVNECVGLLIHEFHSRGTLIPVRCVKWIMQVDDRDNRTYCYNAGKKRV